MTAHLSLSSSCISWVCPPLSTVFYDQYHQDIVIIQRNENHSENNVNNEEDSNISYHFSYQKLGIDGILPPSITSFVNIKLDPSHKILAIQTSSTDISFIFLSTMSILTSLSIPVASNIFFSAFSNSTPSFLTIMNFEWFESITRQSFICIITPKGLYLYYYNFITTSFQMAKQYSRNILHYWVSRPSPSGPLLIVDDHFHFTFYFNLHSLSPYYKRVYFNEISNCLVNHPDYHLLWLVPFYHKLAVVFVDKSAGLIRRYMPLDSIDAESEYTSLPSWPLFVTDLEVNYALSIIDGVIVIHNLRDKVPLLYSFYSQYSQPILSPLPLLTVNLDGTTITGYNNQWIFVDSIHILSCPHYSNSETPSPSSTPSYCSLYNLKLDLKGIIDTWGSDNQENLLAFLLARSEPQASELSISFLSSLCQDLQNLSIVTSYFNLINQILQPFLRDTYETERKIPSKNSAGLSILSPYLLLNKLFKQLSSPKTNLIFFQTYFLSLIYFQIRIPEDLYKYLFRLFIDYKDFSTLSQYLRHNIFPNKCWLVDRLLEIETDFPEAFQLSLDILYRLCLDERILTLLLQRKMIYAALRSVESHSRLFEHPHLSPCLFLQASIEVDEDSYHGHFYPLFLSSYTYFQKRNQILRDNPQFLPQDQCDIYVSLYNKLQKNEEI